MSIIETDRIQFELRRGRAIKIGDKIFIHPEFLTEEKLQKISSKNPHLIITALRANAVMGEEFDSAQQIEISSISLQDVFSITMGKNNQNIALQNVDACQEINAALELARIAELLPAIISYDSDEDLPKIEADKILDYKNQINQSLILAAETPLNLKHADKAQIKAFRPANGGMEHLAIIIGDINNEPLVRVHSSCYTGDLLASLACDCGDQLVETISLMNKSGGGIILYLMQEGRGIGLINKLKAYSAQKDGLDTVEANEFLGFDDEERIFEPAAFILKELGISSIKLVTNNPRKAKDLKELGIKVTEMVPLLVSHEHNHGYLETKAKKSGHIINN